MANHTYVESDGSGPCSAAAYCSGRSLGAGTIASFLMEIGGSSSLGLKGYTMTASEATVITGGMFGVVPSGVNQIDAQTIAVNFRVGVAAAGTPQLNEVHICVLNSGCTNLRTVGSAINNQTLTAGGLFTQNVTVAAPVEVAPGDIIAILLVMSNLSCAGVIQNFAFNPETSTVIAMSQVDADDELPLLGAG